MHEFIIEIVKSDEIYRKIANASLEKKDDIYRYDFMKKFETQIASSSWTPSGRKLVSS